jgi:hypothetical protein
MDAAIANLEKANRLLEAASNVPETKKVIDLAAAATIWARKSKLGLDAQNNAARIKIHAERKAGEYLAKLERGKGNQHKSGASNVGQSSQYATALEEAGATRQDANRWQKVAKIPDAELSRILDEQHGAGEITTHSVLLASAAGGSRKAMHSSETNEWYTPERYIVSAVKVLEAIDLDPASHKTANEHIGAARIFTAEDDGLSKIWAGRIWLNPPYGKNEDNISNQAVWSSYLFDQYAAGNTEHAILLTNAVTDCGWFQRLWDFPICFVEGRIAFLAPDGSPAKSPTHGSVFVYLGSRQKRFAKEFSQYGRVVMPQEVI